MGHCSHFVPKEIKKIMALNKTDILRQSDLYTDQIFNIADCHVVKSKISRLVVDMNRAPDDIEAEMELCDSCVVVKITSDGKIVYKKPPTVDMIMTRVEKYHNDFHDEVLELAEGAKFLIDGHSMWSKAPKMKEDAGKARPDICLGNRRFATCDAITTNYIKKAFEGFGYSVAVNKPYEGAFLLGYHCHRRQLPGIQVEINKKLYLNESTLRPYPEKIKLLNKQIGEVVDGLIERL